MLLNCLVFYVLPITGCFFICACDLSWDDIGPKCSRSKLKYCEDFSMFFSIRLFHFSRFARSEGIVRVKFYVSGFQPSPGVHGMYLGLPHPSGQKRPPGTPVRPRLGDVVIGTYGASWVGFFPMPRLPR
jgi:hypothetical protein